MFHFNYLRKFLHLYQFLLRLHHHLYTDLRTSKGTSTQILLLCRNMWAYVEVEYIHRKSHCCARVRNVDDACNVSLNGCTGEQQVDLIVVVAYRTVSAQH